MFPERVIRLLQTTQVMYWTESVFLFLFIYLESVFLK